MSEKDFPSPGRSGHPLPGGERGEAADAAAGETRFRDACVLALIPLLRPENLDGPEHLIFAEASRQTFAFADALVAEWRKRDERDAEAAKPEGTAGETADGMFGVPGEGEI